MPRYDATLSLIRRLFPPGVTVTFTPSMVEGQDNTAVLASAEDAANALATLQDWYARSGVRPVTVGYVEHCR